MNKCQNSAQVVSMKEKQHEVILFNWLCKGNIILYSCGFLFKCVDFYSAVWIFIAAPLLFAAFRLHPVE
jgi:hypothetical protein